MTSSSPSSARPRTPAKRDELSKQMNDMLTKDSFTHRAAHLARHDSRRSPTRIGGEAINAWDSELWNIARLVSQEVMSTRVASALRRGAALGGPPDRAPDLPGQPCRGAIECSTITLRRLIISIPVLLLISLIIFLLLNLAPGDPLAQPCR